MQVSLGFPVDMVEVAVTLLTWGLILYLIYYLYQKKGDKVPVPLSP